MKNAAHVGMSVLSHQRCFLILIQLDNESSSIVSGHETPCVLIVSIMCCRVVECTLLNLSNVVTGLWALQDAALIAGKIYITEDG